MIISYNKSAKDHSFKVYAWSIMQAILFFEIKEVIHLIKMIDIWGVPFHIHAVWDFYLPLANRPGTGDYKMPDVCQPLRPLVTFYKKLHIYFAYQNKFTKLTQNVDVNKAKIRHIFYHFWPHSEKQDGRQSRFLNFFLHFS